MSVATSSFFSTYAQLIQLESPAPADAFFTTEDYHKIDSLGPTLPKLPYDLPAANTDTSSNDDVVTVNVKSIKPPFKFATLLNGVPLSSSIYKIKTRLVDEVDALKSAGAAAGDLKVMVKAKVVADSTLLLALVVGDADISFTVLVSAPKAKSVEPAVEAPAEKASVSAATWLKILDLLAADLGDDAAQAALAKFKTVL